MTSILHDVAFATRDALIAELGEARADELRAAGATCPVEDIVLRTRRALLTPDRASRATRDRSRAC